MLLDPWIQFFIDETGVIIDREKRYALNSAEIYVSWTEHCFHTPINRENMQIYSKHFLIKKNYFLAAFYIGELTFLSAE